MKLSDTMFDYSGTFKYGDKSINAYAEKVASMGELKQENNME